MKLLIKNGQVIDTKNNLQKQTDVLICNGVIDEIGENLPEQGCEVIDAQGKYVLPGLVDAHCHLRDPGFEYKEDIITGTCSAALGGFTSIACMPNTSPVTDNKAIVSYIVNKAKTEGKVHVHPIGAITKGLKGEELAEMAEMKSYGAIAVSDDGKPVRNAALMKKAMQYASMFGLPVISHCEDADLAEEGVMNEGYQSTIQGLKGIPAPAEEIMVSRDLILAEYLQVPIHIAHVSTALSVDLIRHAKQRGVKVTAETCPHYFSLTEEACSGFNTLAKVNPPLRTQQDVDAIIQGLQDGTIDMIATDHAPHHADEKKVEFNAAAFGMVGFETAFALAVTKLVKPGYLTLGQLVDKMSHQPAKMLGLPKGTIEPGAAADIILVDMEQEWMVQAAALSSRSKNTPFEGWMLTGRVCSTIVDGQFVVRDQKLI